MYFALNVKQKCKDPVVVVVVVVVVGVLVDAAGQGLKASPVRATHRRSHKTLYIPAFSLALSRALARRLYASSLSVPESKQ